MGKNGESELHGVASKWAQVSYTWVEKPFTLTGCRFRLKASAAAPTVPSVGRATAPLACTKPAFEILTAYEKRFAYFLQSALVRT